MLHKNAAPSSLEPHGKKREAEAAPPDAGVVHRWSRLVRQLLQWLPNPFRASTVVAVTVLGITTALVLAWCNAGAVSLLPFEGPDGTRLSMQLAAALDEVARGAESGVDMDLGLRRTAQLPDSAIPGMAISLAAIVRAVQIGPLAVTEVRGALEHEGDTYRLWLRVDGPNTSEHALHTDAMKTLDAAMTAGAELLYRALRPIGAASYLFSRVPERSLELVDRVLRDATTSQADKGAAHRLWGLVLRDQRDYDDARDQFAKALELTVDGKSRARIRIDIGYTYMIEKRWEEAATAFDLAANTDPNWAAPLSLRADALRELRRFDDADRLYHEAIERDQGSGDPWLGLGLTRKAGGAYRDALDAYVRARRLTLSRDKQATIALEIGELFSETGCPDDAVTEWDRAVTLSPLRGADRPDWKDAGACLLSQPSVDAEASTRMGCALLPPDCSTASVATGVTGAAG